MRTFAQVHVVMASFCLACGVVTQDAGANLIVNGSFEEGPATFSTPMDVGSTSIVGWTVTRDQIDYVGGYWQASDGTKSLDLNGSPGVGGIAQTFATVSGQEYVVRFDQACNPYGGARLSRLGVAAPGQSAEFDFDSAGKSTYDMGWVTRTWQFTATGEQTTLEFYSLDAPQPFFGPALDNVIVVPEPATLSLVGVSGIVLLKRRRKPTP